jgi:20S proteasome alpha/beta subunit
MLRHEAIQRLRRQPLTCIIGAKCAEGFAIAADTRVLTEYEATNENKIEKLWEDRIAVAGSGTTLLFHNLVDELSVKNNLPSAKSSLEAVKIVEDVMAYLQTRYRSRLDSKDFKLDALMLGLEGFDAGEPYLKVMDERGVSQSIQKYVIIGHGSESATPLFRLLYDPNLTLRELAILECFVISLVVTLDVDQSVGFSGAGPQVVGLRDDSKVEDFSPYDADFVHATNLTKIVSLHPVVGHYVARFIWKELPMAYGGKLPFFREPP